MGEGTDVVRKEMYDFLDKGDRHIALRPEGTASVVRAYVEHRPPTPWKVWYAAPSFRYERAQADRYRQHHQLGAEAIGSADPDLDVEVIWPAVRLLPGDRPAPGRSGHQLHGHARRSGRLHRAAASFLVGHIDELAPDDQEKVEAHPMRVLDSKRARDPGA